MCTIAALIMVYGSRTPRPRNRQTYYEGQSDEASMEKKVWRNCGLPLLALARYLIEIALPYWDAVSYKVKRCAQDS